MSSGSTIATVASMSGLRKLALQPCSGDARTALEVTSEPVPAVVAAAMNGNDGLSMGLPSPMTSR